MSRFRKSFMQRFDSSIAAEHLEELQFGSTAGSEMDGETEQLKYLRMALLDTAALALFNSGYAQCCAV